MEGLTARQASILDFIVERVEADKRAPTIRDIAARFRIASTHGVRRHLKALERKGCIERDFNSPRSIRLSPDVAEQSGLPILGRVAAGTAILAIENIEGYLPLDTLYPRRKGHFCLRVQGDSMIDAGIWDGDYVIVRQKADFENGEIGVAVVDGEATVKRLHRDGPFVELIPENEEYESRQIDLTAHDFTYAGEVVAVHRALKIA